MKFGGFDILIENLVGFVCSGVDGDGKLWFVEMKSYYGYIKGIVGCDKDYVDIFVKLGIELFGDNLLVYVVD